MPEPTWERIYAAMTNLTMETQGQKPTRKEREAWNNLRLHAVYAEADQLRVYPNGSLAGQVIGFPAVEETNVNGRFISQIVGRDGIELSDAKEIERRGRLARDGDGQGPARTGGVAR